MDATLLLNADAMPINLLPLSAISWEEAIKGMYLGTAEVLHYYEDWEVHSPSVSMQVPAVVILKEQVHVKRNLRLANTGPKSSLVFLRDGFQCQYCRELFPRHQLTMDHVLPRKFGGTTRWDNISTACYICNGRRGHDVRIQPIMAPYRPTYSQLVKMMKKFPIRIPHPTWNYYLGWDESRLMYVDPRNRKPSTPDDTIYYEK
jgi:5-methylcytosine-specific restriction endonuclease McrA